MTLTLQEADTRAREILDALGPHCGRIETTGEIRRRCPTVERIEVVLIPGDPMEIQHFIMRGAGHIELFGSHIARVEMLDHTRINFHFAHDDQSTPYHGYPCNWGSVQLFTTGPKSYTDSVRRRATMMRCFWNVDHGLFNSDGVCIASATEEEILSRLGLDYLTPEARQ